MMILDKIPMVLIHFTSRTLPFLYLSQNILPSIYTDFEGFISSIMSGDAEVSGYRHIEMAPCR